MLENFVAAELSSVLGAYIEDFSPSQVLGLGVLGVWNGQMSLQHLRLRRDAFDAFELPFRVANGYIGRLDISVPWTRLQTEPVCVRVHDLYVSLDTDFSWDDEMQRRAADLLKKNVLLQSERRSKGQRPGFDASFAERLLDSILDNLRVEMMRVHIRVEDRVVCGSARTPTALSLRLQSLTAESCDQNAQRCFTSRSDSFLYKSVRLSGLSVHWHSPEHDAAAEHHERDDDRNDDDRNDDDDDDDGSSVHSMTLDPERFSHTMSSVFSDDARSWLQMHSSLSRSHSMASTSFPRTPPVSPTDTAAAAATTTKALPAIIRMPCLLWPVDASMMLRISRIDFAQSSSQVPKFSVEFDFEQLSLTISQQTWQEIADLLRALIAFQQRVDRFGASDMDVTTPTPTDAVIDAPVRPEGSPTAEPRLWWRFASAAALAFDRRHRRRRRRHPQWSWTYMRAFRVDLRAYIGLWKAYLRSSTGSTGSTGTAADSEDVRSEAAAGDAATSGGYDEEPMRAIEARWSVSQVLLMRSIAEHELAGEEALAEVQKQRQSRRRRRLTSTGVFRSVFRRWLSRGQTNDDDENDIDDDENDIDDDDELQQEYVFSRLGYDPTAPLQLLEELTGGVSRPQFSCSVRLGTCCLDLLGANQAPVAQLLLQGIDVQVKQRSSSTMVSAVLQGLYAFDQRSIVSDSRFTRIICPGGRSHVSCAADLVSAHDTNTSRSHEAPDNADDDAEPTAATNDDDDDDDDAPLLQVRVTRICGGPDDDGDDDEQVDVWLSMRPLEVVLSTCFASALEILQPPPSSPPIGPGLLRPSSPTSSTSSTSSPPSQSSLSALELHRVPSPLPTRLEYAMVENRVRFKLDIGVQRVDVLIPHAEARLQRQHPFVRLQVRHIAFSTPLSPTQSSTYDNVELHLLDVCASLLPASDAALLRRRRTSSTVGPSKYVLEPFDVNVTLRSSLCPSDPTQTLALLRIDVPPLTARLSRLQLHQLVAIAASFSRPSCTSPPMPASASPTHRLVLSLSRSLSLSGLVNESVAVDSTAQLNMLLLDAVVSVPMLDLRLLHDDTVAAAELVSMSVEGLSCSLQCFRRDWRAQLRLRSILVEDGAMPPQSEFRFLFASSTLTASTPPQEPSQEPEQTMGEEQDAELLLRMSLSNAEPSSPRFEGCRQRVELLCGVVHLNWNPATMLALLRFFTDAVDSLPVSIDKSGELPEPDDGLEALRAIADRLKPRPVPSTSSSSSTTSGEAAKDGESLRVSALLQSLTLSLNSTSGKLASTLPPSLQDQADSQDRLEAEEEQQQQEEVEACESVARLELSQLQADVRRSTSGGVWLSGELGSLTLVDLSSEVAPRYSNVLSKRSSDRLPLLRFSFTTITTTTTTTTTAASTEQPQYDAKLTLRIAPLRWVIVPRFLNNLAQYLHHIEDWSSSASADVDSVGAVAPYLLKLDVLVSGVLLLVPREWRRSRSGREYLVLDMGDLRVQKGFHLSESLYSLASDTLEHIPLGFTSLSFSSLQVFEAPRSQHGNIVNDVDLHVSIEEPLVPLLSLDCGALPNKRIDATVSDLAITLHRSSVSLCECLVAEFRSALGTATLEPQSSSCATSSASFSAKLELDRIALRLLVATPAPFDLVGQPQPQEEHCHEQEEDVAALVLDLRTTTVLLDVLQEDGCQELSCTIGNVSLRDMEQDASSPYQSIVHMRQVSKPSSGVVMHWWSGNASSHRIDVTLLAPELVVSPRIISRLCNVLCSMLPHVPPASAAASPTPFPAPSSAESGSMHLKVALQKPQVWLLDADENGSSMVLQGTASFNHQTSPDNEVEAMLDMREVRCLVCYRTSELDLTRLSPAPVPVFEPFNIVLSYSQRLQPHLQQQWRHSLISHVSMLDVCLSFQDMIASLRILDSISVAVRAAQQALRLPPDVDEVQQQQQAPTQAVLVVGAGTELLGRVELHTQGITLAIVNDAPGYYLPLVQLAAPDLSLKGSLNADEMVVTLEASVEASYHSSAVMEWEPLLETWTFAAELRRSTAHDDAVQIVLESSHVLNLNLTPSALTNLGIGVQCLHSHLLANVNRLGEGVADVSSSSFRVRNESGSSLKFRVETDSTPTSLTDPSLQQMAQYGTTKAQQKLLAGNNSESSDACGGFELLLNGEERALDLYQLVRGGNRRLWTYSCPSLSVLVQGPPHTNTRTGSFDYWYALDRIALDSSTAGDTFVQPLRRRLGSTGPGRAALTHHVHDHSWHEGSARNPSPSPSASSPPPTPPLPSALVAGAKAGAGGAAAGPASDTYLNTCVMAPTDGTTALLLLRSPIHVRNDTAFDVQIRVVTGAGALVHSEVVKAGATCPLPLWLLELSLKAALVQLRPLASGAASSASAFTTAFPCADLHDLARLAARVLRCSGAVPGPSVCFCSVRASTDGSSIVLEAPLALHNELPVPLDYELRSTTTESDTLSGTLASGTSLDVHTNDLVAEVRARFRCEAFDWSASVSLCPTLPKDALVLASSLSSSCAPLRLSLDDLDGLAESCRRVRVSVPYWILNRTGLPLLYSQPIPPGYKPKHADADAVSTHSHLLAPGQQQASSTAVKPNATAALPVWPDDAPWYTFAGPRRREAENRARGLQLLLDEYEEVPHWTPACRDLDSQHCATMFAFSEIEYSAPPLSSAAAAATSTAVVIPSTSSLSPSSSRERRMCVQVSGSSEWSQPFSPDSVASDGCLSLPDVFAHSSSSVSPSDKAAMAPTDLVFGSYEFAVHIALLDPDASSGTKLVTLAPRYVLQNSTGSEVQFRQEGTNQVAELASGASSAVHRFDGSRAACICVRFREYGSAWSGAVALDVIGSVAVRIHNLQRGGHRIVRVQCRLVDGAFHIELADQTRDPLHPPPYRIENFTFLTLCCRQEEVDASVVPSEMVLPYHARPYAWDAPMRSRRLHVDAVNAEGEVLGHVGTVSLDRIADQSPVRLAGHERAMPHSRELLVRVVADGPIRVLRVIDSMLELPDLQQQHLKREQQQQQNALTVGVRVAGIGVSIIEVGGGRMCRELAYLSVSGLRLSALRNQDVQELELSIASCQLDNQLPQAQYKVLLAPKPTLSQQPFLQIRLVYSRRHSHQALLFFPYASLLLQAAHIRLEEEFLARLAYQFQPLQQMFAYNAAIALNNDQQQAASESPPLCLYFSSLVIHPIRVDVSFSMSASPHTRASNPIGIMLRAVGVTLANIDSAPVRLNAVLLSDAFASPEELAARLYQNYSMQLVREWYKLLGSVDLLGNPVGLLSNLCTGVTDLFYEPALGLVHSPQAFGAGLLRGATSLVRNSVYGVSNTASKISGSIYKGLSSLTSTQQHRQLSVGGSVYHGMGGLLLQPYRGMLDEGLSGAARGLFGASLAVFLLPLIALFNSATRASDAVRSLMDTRKLPNRVRAPRQFERGRVLRPYSWYPEQVLQYFASSLSASSAKTSKKSGVALSGGVSSSDSGGGSGEYVLGFASAVATNVYVVLTTEHVVALPMHGAPRALLCLHLDEIFSLTRSADHSLQFELMDGTPVRRLEIGTEQEAQNVLHLFKYARRLRRRLRRRQQKGSGGKAIAYL